MLESRNRSVIGLAVLTLLDVVTEQRVLIPNVEFAIRYHRMRPGRFVRAFRLIEPPALQVFLSAGFDQNNRAFLGSVINSTIRERDGSFGHAALVRIPFVPQNLTRLKVETSEIATAVPAVRAKQSAIVKDHAAVMIFHRF